MQQAPAYFNFILNNKQFSGGPALRNKLLHGQQASEGNEAAYLIALRTLIALVIKINDDFRVAFELVGETGTT